MLALASAEFDLSNIPVGNTVTVKWRGKPVFIKHRSPDEISKCNGADVSSMRDPEADSVRAKEVRIHFKRKDANNSCNRLCGHVASCTCTVFLLLSRLSFLLWLPWRFVPLTSHPCAVVPVTSFATFLPRKAGVAGVHGDLHPLGLRAHHRRGRLRRLVLPLPRLPLRRVGPDPQGPSAPQPGNSAVLLRERVQDPGRLNQDGDFLCC